MGTEDMWHCSTVVQLWRGPLEYCVGYVKHQCAVTYSGFFWLNARQAVRPAVCQMLL
jgi:hypothetical protein